VFNNTDRSSSGLPPIDVTGWANVTIYLVDGTTNTVKNTRNNSGIGYNQQGIQVDQVAKLTIQGNTGTLIAQGSVNSAAIGGFYHTIPASSKSGTIIIEGGIVKATGGSGAAGIGGGRTGTGGVITITGGTVESNSSGGGAAMGGGVGADCGTIIINGGIVEVESSGGGAAIGSGSGANCGSITINGGTVRAESKGAAAAIGNPNNINGGNVKITGGIVWAKSNNVNIYGVGGNTTGSIDVNITGGSVYSVNSNEQIHIYSTPKNGNVPVYCLIALVKSGAAPLSNANISMSTTPATDTYTAKTNEEGYAYLWLPAGSYNYTLLDPATGRTKEGTHNFTVPSDLSNPEWDQVEWSFIYKPEISPIDGATVCGGDNVVLSITNTASYNNPSYKWHKIANNITTLVGTDPTYTANTLGDYYVEITDEGLSIDSDTITIIVKPVITFDSPTTIPTMCSGEMVEYTAESATAGATFNWFRVEIPGIEPATSGASSSTIDERLTNTTSNPMTVIYVFMVSANGCSIIQIVQVTVDPVADISHITGPADETICSGSSITLTAESSGIDNPVYHWYNSAEMLVYAGQDYTTTILENDVTYYVSVHGTNRCEMPFANRKPVTITVVDSGSECDNKPPDRYEVEIIVNENVKTDFDFGDELEYCAGESNPETLPTTSNNGIVGTWDYPAIVTTTVGTRYYVFSPDTDIEQCYTGDGKFTLKVTIHENVVTSFAFGDELDYCVGESNPVELLETSSNGISGTWDYPAIVTTTVGTRYYVFSPDTDIEQCYTGDRSDE
jgi:hypothetical protein